jgi:nucleotide-binding universal stress UspA family protein
MGMFRHILIAVSGNSDHTALVTAIRLSHEHRALVTVLHVADWVPYIQGAEMDFGALLTCAEEHGRMVIAQAAELLSQAGCTADTHMITQSTGGGSLGKAIANFAYDKGAELIVLGKRPTGWWHWVAENVSSQVQRHAKVPVLIASGERFRRVPAVKQWSKPLWTY